MASKTVEPVVAFFREGIGDRMCRGVMKIWNEREQIVKG
jgi:hypothetical protein